jgi:Uncharacterized protein conserved in bacteria
MDKAVYYFREQQYDIALCMVANSIDQIKLVLEAIITDREYFHLVDTESMLEMLSRILEAKKNRDYILLADLLELQLISFLTGVQELIISKEEIFFDEESYKDNIKLLLENEVNFPQDMSGPFNTDELLKSGYRVEFTSCGQMTLVAENEGAKFYFHTNSRVQQEAFLLARRWYRESITKYILYGFGMGYHINEIQAIAKDAEIEVYEADKNIVQLACAFADVKQLLCNGRIKLIFDPELKQLSSRVDSLKPEEALIVHYPSYKNIRSSEEKKMLASRVCFFEEIET